MQHNPVFPHDSPWQRCYADFLRQVSRSHSHATEVAYAGVLSRFFCDGKSPEQYRRADIENFIYGKSDKSWTRSADGEVRPATTNFRLSVLNSFFRYAATYTITGEDGRPYPLLTMISPTTGIKGGKPERTYKALSFEEFTRFFAVIPTDTVMGLRDRAIFLTYFWTARRRSEIARLKWGDIERAMIIEPQGARRMGWVYHFRGKGKMTEDDLAELPEPAMRAIEKYLSVSGRIAEMQPGDPLFLAIGHERGGNVRPGEKRALTEGGIIRRMEYYAERAGLDKRISLHSFRHTAARERRMAGQDILDIKELLRHESLNTTYRYLAKLTSTADTGARLLEEKFGHFSSSQSDLHPLY